MREEFGPLAVDLEELRIALEAEAGEFRWYLDLETGRVILLNQEFDPRENGGLYAANIESTPERFLRVPRGNPADHLGDMVAFSESVADQRLRQSLQLALGAPRPERRFRAVLGWLPDHQLEWQNFHQRRSTQRALAWLESLGILPGDDDSEVTQPG